MSELTLDVARDLAGRAMSRAQQDYGRPICVSVCDAQGFLLAFARMPGAPLRSIRIAQCKAYTAARMGAATDALRPRLEEQGVELADFCDPDLTALPGGSPLKDASGILLGAIGVSGLAASEDHSITEHVAERVLPGLIA